MKFLPTIRSHTGLNATRTWYPRAAWLVLLLGIVAGCSQPAPEVTATSGSSDSTESGPATAPDPALRPAASGKLRIAAASDLKFALAKIVAEFEQAHPGAQVSVTVGSSGQLFSQLSHEAPFDLFLSADIEYANNLAQVGHGFSAGAFPYARGHIVLWKPGAVRADGAKLHPDQLREGNVKTIAVANPKTAPYGRAAIEALRTLWLYEALEPKLVYGESVAQTAQMVESGAADVGIIALSLALSPALRDRGHFWPFPSDSYQPLIQGGVILSWAEDRALAEDFREFLINGPGATHLADFGFDPPH
ncbi:MAG: molybdate ABC transporter substrate-binding protein [Planctomycetes bacterium]|nr:molybdate ABC transporter substrate-binding protein [Planctomycetota bacterium]